MKQSISVIVLCLLAFVSTAMARQQDIEIENNLPKEEIFISQYPERSVTPYFPIKEVDLKTGQKANFTYQWKEGDPRVHDMNIEIRGAYTSAKLCNLLLWNNSVMEVENFWYPKIPELNTYQCDSKINSDGSYSVTIKKRN